MAPYYNFAAGTFHTKKLCSRLYSIELEFHSQKRQIQFFSHTLGRCNVLRIRTSFIARWKARGRLPIRFYRCNNAMHGPCPFFIQFVSMNISLHCLYQQCGAVISLLWKICPKSLSQARSWNERRRAHTAVETTYMQQTYRATWKK